MEQIRLLWRDTPVGVLWIDDGALEIFVDGDRRVLVAAVIQRGSASEQRTLFVGFVVAGPHADARIDLAAPIVEPMLGAGERQSSSALIGMDLRLRSGDSGELQLWKSGLSYLTIDWREGTERPRICFGLPQRQVGVELEPPWRRWGFGTARRGWIYSLRWDDEPRGRARIEFSRGPEWRERETGRLLLYGPYGRVSVGLVEFEDQRAAVDDRLERVDIDGYVRVTGSWGRLAITRSATRVSEPSWLEWHLARSRAWEVDGHRSVWRQVLEVLTDPSRALWPTSGAETGSPVSTEPTSPSGKPLARGHRTSVLVKGAVVGATATVAGLIFSLTGMGVPGASEGGAMVVGALGAAGAGALGLPRVASATRALVRRTRAAREQRTSQRVVEAAGAEQASLHAAPPPSAMAYRPSWVLPRRQSAIHVYVVMPEAMRRVEREARKALDAPGNAARKSHAIPLGRGLFDGEMLLVEVELADFEVGAVVPVAWRSPYVRFVVPIRARADIAVGVHRPMVRIRAERAGDALASFDFDLDVRASRPRLVVGRGATVTGCAVMASAALTATVQDSLPPAVGWPVSAACLVGGASTWAIQRTAMVQADVRDRAAVFVSYAAEDRERAKRAIHLLQEARRFPAIEVEAMLAERQPIDAIARADRVFVFWSDRASASSEVTREWQAAIERGGAAGGRSQLVMPVVLGQDRLDAGHPLARLDSIDLGALADALIVTAVKDEYDAVLGVDTGAAPGGAWQRRVGPAGLEVAFREFAVERGALRIAVTQALGMGGVSAVDASAKLIDAYRVRCLAMCGVCAGRRGDVELGDVIIADRLWQYDAGKRKVVTDAHGERVVREQGDIDMYKIQPPAWKHAAERFELDDSLPWLRARPLSYADQGDWILERISRQADPASDPAQGERCPDYARALARLWAKGLLVDGKLALTAAGSDHIERQLALHRGALPERKRLCIHVGPIASGNKVIEDAEVFPLLADSVRKVLGVEMEAAAIGTLASSSQLPYSVVMKAVMDHADPDKSDNFKAFAARASAECLIAFLRHNLPPRTPPIP